MSAPLRLYYPLMRYLPVFLLLISPVWANDVRYLTFSARDENGIYLRDLKREEVSLSIDDQPIEVGYLGNKNVETAFVFMIENSPRTAPYPVSMPQWGQINILDQIRYHLMHGALRPVVENGAALLAEFYREIKTLQDFTSKDYLLEEALYKMAPNSTGIEKERIPVGRALARGVDLLRARPEKRKILVLFTTTIDRDSYRDLDEYREMLRARDLDLYVVSFAARFPTGPGFTFEEKMNTHYFRRLASETGGKAYISGEYVYVPEFMDDLMSRLANSYTIGFYIQPEKEPRPHSIRLKVRNDKIDVTCRQKIVY